MKLSLAYLPLIALLFCQCSVFSQITGIKSSEKWDPKLTEAWEPVPRIVTPGQNFAPPSDAIILFDGSNTAEWIQKNGSPVRWELSEGAMTVLRGSGDILTKKEFGDCQLHIEWRTPVVIKGTGQGRGNSGIFLQGRYEIQILDSYNNATYPNGQAGSVYKQSIPLVNASHKPGEWQSYDIIYKAPRFNPDGMKLSSAYITVIHNGILIQNHVEIKGTTEYIGLPKNEAHGKAPIILQDHGDRVSFRNIWVREL